MNTVGRCTSARQGGPSTTARSTPFEVERTSCVTGRMRSVVGGHRDGSQCELANDADDDRSRILVPQRTNGEGAMGSSLVLPVVRRVGRVRRFLRGALHHRTVHDRPAESARKERNHTRRHRRPAPATPSDHSPTEREEHFFCQITGHRQPRDVLR